MGAEGEGQPSCSVLIQGDPLTEAQPGPAWTRDPPSILAPLSSAMFLVVWTEETT